MTKDDLLKVLINDKRPMETEVKIYLECTNNDASIIGTITGVEYDKNFLSIFIQGDYEEDET